LIVLNQHDDTQDNFFNVAGQCCHQVRHRAHKRSKLSR